MTHPRTEVLGVYSPVIDLKRFELFVREYMFEMKKPIPDSEPLSDERLAEIEQELRHNLAAAVLVEVTVSDRNEQFNVADFVQPDPTQPKGMWQAPWAEVYLSNDGESLACERWMGEPTSPHLRIAFYIHFWIPGGQLLSSFGPLTLPSIAAVPERLWRLAPYECVD